MSYQVQIEVVRLEILEGLVDGLFYILGMMVGVPQLAVDLEIKEEDCQSVAQGMVNATKALTKISSRGTPDFFQPFPTSDSFW